MLVYWQSLWKVCARNNVLNWDMNCGILAPHVQGMSSSRHKLHKNGVENQHKDVKVNSKERYLALS